jgi:hypothetical protein
MKKSDKIKKVIDQIDSIINELKQKKITKEIEMEDYFWDNHSDIMNEYPFLVCQLISGADRNMLKYMLYTLDRIETGKQEQNDADVEIGQKIVDDYIKPNLK